MQSLVNEADKVRAAYRSAQANVNQEFAPEVVAACQKASEERMERIATGQTTAQQEEAKLLALWKQLK
ncbi:hypothetical protein [Acinetobacter sp. YH01009]|uniref:hypothetical protein n=1 Tax=Acinetobacter TaxID=469 RepID=UPI0015D3C65F|nr:hypothetical protein [Acinetobacter sp. YH01009]